MKIYINQIPPGGLVIEETVSAKELDLENLDFNFLQPIRVRLEVQKITNAVTVIAQLRGAVKTICSRCLAETSLDLDRELNFNYQVQKMQDYIDCAQDIREEIVLGLPLKVLCRPGCRGLCPRCGKDLNAGDCSCK
jgi:uncharacterized protein